jgi:hypothetical protein
MARQTAATSSGSTVGPVGSESTLLASASARGSGSGTCRSGADRYGSTWWQIGEK